MNVFDAVKEAVTARQAAEFYGLKVGRYGMACCPFHDDKHPSLKLDKRYYCFGCGAKGSVIDLVANLYGLDPTHAALKIAADFGVPYEYHGRGVRIPPSPTICEELKFRKERDRMLHVYNNYVGYLYEWEREYAPSMEDEHWHPLFEEAADKTTYMEYLLEILTDGPVQDQKELIRDKWADMEKLEDRLAVFDKKRQAERIKSLKEELCL